MASDDFKWSDVANDIVQESVSIKALAVYENPARDIVLRQEQDDHQEEDQVVVIRRSNAEKVIEKIQALLNSED